MKKMKYILLFVTLLIIMVGIVSATEVSYDVTDTDSITEEAVTQDTHKVSDTADNIQENIADKDMQASKSSDNKLDENTTKTITKNAETNLKTADAPITNWEELQAAINNTHSAFLRLTLGDGTYKTNGTIRINTWKSFAIDGRGQTIDANKQQAFIIERGAYLVLENLTIINGEATEGGAIKNYGSLTVQKSILANNSAESGGAIENRGELEITQSILKGNTAEFDGGAINNLYNLTIKKSTLSDNVASRYGGAIRNSQYNFNITGSNFTNNYAGSGGAIFSSGYRNLTNNTFINNTADDMETIYLTGLVKGRSDNNIYKSNDIDFKNIALKIKDNQSIFNPYEDVVLNFNISLRNPLNYDKDILERLDDITIYVNGVEYATTKYEDYTLSNLSPGNYSVYITSCNQKSKSVAFKVTEINDINLTTWDVEMVQSRGVTFSAVVDYENTTINQGQVYFEIDGNPLVDENGSILYAPVKDNHADLPYDNTNDISLGNHTLTAVYLYDDRILATDNKTLTVIENIPEGAGDEIPSKEEKQDTYTKDTRAHKTIANTIQSNIPAIHQIIVGNIVIPADTVITLGELNEMFDQTFANGHLLLYIDGQLVYNGTVGDDLATVILEIIEKFLGEHELKVEFTDSNNQTQTYTKNVTIA